jgi:hypothetical protein
MNPGVDEKTLERAAAARDERAIGQKRSRTGATFQQQLRGTHENYLNRGWGFVLEQYPPFKKVRRGDKWEWTPVGNGRCDYAGHVNIDPSCRTTEFALGGILAHPAPVYFDAKVLGKKKGATYVHPTEQQHQLLDLRAALRGGGYAFLLVHAPEVERAFVIGIAEHFEVLMRGNGIRLWEREPVGLCRPVPPFGEIFPRLPWCEYSLAIGWHWAPQLRFIQGGET